MNIGIRNQDPTNDNNIISTFDAMTGNKVQAFEYERSASSCISPDGRWIAFEKRLRSIREQEKSCIAIVNATTGEVAELLKGYGASLRGFGFNANSSCLQTLHQQGIVTWPLQCAFPSEKMTASIWMTTSADGRWQTQDLNEWSESHPGSPKVTLIDWTGVNPPIQLQVLGYPLDQTFSPKSDYIVTTSVDENDKLSNAGILKVCETRTGREILSLNHLSCEVNPKFGSKRPWLLLTNHLAYSPKDQRIAIAVPRNDEASPTAMIVRIWDLASGAEQTQPNAPIEIPYISKIKFSADGEKLLILPQSPVPRKVSIQAFEARSGKLSWVHEAVSYGTVNSTNGSLIASVVDDGGETQVVGWAAENGNEVFRTPWRAERALFAVAIADDRTAAALVSESQTKIIDTKKGTEIFAMEVTDEKVLDVTFSSDGDRIVTCFGGSANLSKNSPFSLKFDVERPRGCIVWDSRTGQELLTLRMPTLEGPPKNLPLSIDQHKNVIQLGNWFTWNGAPLSTSTEAKELLVAGRSLLLAPNSNKAGQERAVLFLNEAIRLDPHIPDARRLLALAHVQMGRMDEALSSIGVKGIESETTVSSTAEELTLRAIAMHQRGQQAEAKQLLEKAQRTASDSEAVWQLLVQQAKQQLKIPPAEQNPQAWIGHKFMPRAFYPNASFPYLVSKVKGDRLSVGIELITSSKLVSLSDSIEYYTSVIAATPKSDHSWNFRGAAYNLLGEYDNAIDDYTRAIELRREAAYSIHRGNLYVRVKKSYDLAMADFDHAIAIEPTKTRAHALIICTLRRMGKPEQALEKANESIRVELIPGASRNGYNHCERAYVHAALGNVESMRADFEEAIRLSPDDREIWLSKAWLLSTSTDEAHRDGKQAIDAATKACELTVWKDEDALGHLAAAYAQSGDFAKAAEWQKKAIEYAPPAKRPKLELRLNLYSDGKPYRESLVD